MRKTPVYAIPYLDGSEKAWEIINASKATAEGVEAALQSAGARPADTDLETISARLNALEQVVSAQSVLPLMQLTRTDNYTATTPRSYEALPWQSALEIGQGLQWVPGTNRVRVLARLYLQVIFQIQNGARDEDRIAMRIIDASGNPYIASQAALPSQATNIIAYTIKVAPGDEILTEWRAQNSVSLNSVNTFVSLLGLRTY